MQCHPNLIRGRHPRPLSCSFWTLSSMTQVSLYNSSESAAAWGYPLDHFHVLVNRAENLSGYQKDPKVIHEKNGKKNSWKHIGSCHVICDFMSSLLSRKFSEFWCLLIGKFLRNWCLDFFKSAFFSVPFFDCIGMSWKSYFLLQAFYSFSSKAALYKVFYFCCCFIM